MSKADVSDLLAVVPAFNEENTIFGVVHTLRELGYQVLVVDDCSTDMTASLACKAGAGVLSLPINLGVGGSLRAGFRYAVASGFSTVVQVDGDGQHPVDEIERLVQAAKSLDAHLVIGSRYLSTHSPAHPSKIRRFAMWLMSSAASAIAGFKLTDTTSGFRIIREPLLSEFAREFPSDYLGDTFQSTVSAIRSGYHVAEIPASLMDRKFGKSSASSLYAACRVFKVIFLVLARLTPPLKSFSNK